MLEGDSIQHAFIIAVCFTTATRLRHLVRTQKTTTFASKAVRTEISRISAGGPIFCPKYVPVLGTRFGTPQNRQMPYFVTFYPFSGDVFVFRKRAPGLPPLSPKSASKNGAECVLVVSARPTQRKDQCEKKQHEFMETANISISLGSEK